jgi:hypothetical protein
MRDHDEELGAALRQLPTPRHRAGFFADLEDHLADEWTMPGRTRRLLRAVRRIPIRWVAASVAAVALFASSLAGLALAGRPHRDVSVVTGAGGSPARPSLPPSISTLGPIAPDTPPEAVVQTVRIHATGFDSTEGIWQATYTLTGDGKFRRGDGTGSTFVQDGHGGTSRVQHRDNQGRTTVVDEVGLPAGPPAAIPKDLQDLRRQLGWTVRALAGDNNPAIVTTRYLGRWAWRYETTLVKGESAIGADHLLAVVDKGTTLPVRIDQSRQGRLISQYRVTRLDVDPAVSATEFSAPSSSEKHGPATRNLGWVRVPGTQAFQGSVVRPWVPELVPAGFTLSDVAFRPASHRDSDDGASVALTYRRGIDVFWVTTTVSGNPRAAVDPLATNSDTRVGPVTISIDPAGIPNLFVVRGNQVITVAGSLTRPELLNLARTVPCTATTCSAGASSTLIP